jgi:hypothetical protein
VELKIAMTLLLIALLVFPALWVIKRRMGR